MMLVPSSTALATMKPLREREGFGDHHGAGGAQGAPVEIRAWWADLLMTVELAANSGLSAILHRKALSLIK